MAEEKNIKAVKVKKKKWIQILSPDLFKNELIGEVPVSELNSLKGRAISLNLMSITRDIKKQNIIIKCIITGVSGERASTKLQGYYLNLASIRRLVRKGKEKIDFSITCRTADNKKIRIMPLMVPYNRVKGSAGAALKKAISSYLASYAAKTRFEEIFSDVASSKLQRALKDEIKKIYPVRILEIAKLHIEKEKNPSVEPPEEPKPEELKKEPSGEVTAGEADEVKSGEKVNLKPSDEVKHIEGAAQEGLTT